MNTDDDTATAREDKKLLDRGQTGRRICAKTVAWLLEIRKSPDVFPADFFLVVSRTVYSIHGSIIMEIRLKKN